CLLHVELDLPCQCIKIFEFLFRPEIADKTHFEILAINFVVKIKQMDFEHPLGFAAAHCRAVPEVHHARIDYSVQYGLREIDPIGGKLLTMSAQISCREPDLFSEVIPADHRPEDCIFAAKHFGGLREVTCFNGVTNRCTTDELAAPERTCGHSNDIEVELR